MPAMRTRFSRISNSAAVLEQIFYDAVQEFWAMLNIPQNQPGWAQQFQLRRRAARQAMERWLSALYRPGDPRLYQFRLNTLAENHLL
jgi:hypothetical protein